MKIPYCLLIVLTCGFFSLSSPAKDAGKDCAKALPVQSLLTPAPTAWLKKHIPLIKSIKAGSTKADLDKLFQPSGGYSSKLTYQYRECPQIRVDVEFRETGDGALDPGNEIISISKPYLDDSFYFD